MSLKSGMMIITIATLADLLTQGETSIGGIGRRSTIFISEIRRDGSMWCWRTGHWLCRKQILRLSPVMSWVLVIVDTIEGWIMGRLIAMPCHIFFMKEFPGVSWNMTIKEAQLPQKRLNNLHFSSISCPYPRNFEGWDWIVKAVRRTDSKAAAVSSNSSVPSKRDFHR